MSYVLVYRTKKDTDDELVLYARPGIARKFTASLTHARKWKTREGAEGWKTNSQYGSFQEFEVEEVED